MLHADAAAAEAVLDRASRSVLVASDGKSGNQMELAELDGRRYVIKHVRVGSDWLARSTGDLCPREVRLWADGLAGDLPDCVEVPVVGAFLDDDERGGTIVMHDVGPGLVPEGDEPVPVEQHRRFVDHIAQLHASRWGDADAPDLTPLGNRYLMFCPQIASIEERLASGAVVPRLIGEGWPRLAELEPGTWELCDSIHRDLGAFVAALARTPFTFLHGDTKMGNLGTTAEGRTILIDWAYVGVGPPLSELAWYLALNAARIPQGKDETIAAYRHSLVAAGVDVDEWFDDQLSLCLLGAMVQFGWEKALGGPGAELDWWVERAQEGAEWL